MQYRKVIESTDCEKIGFDNTKLNYPDKFIFNVKNKSIYSYINEPDGYGYSGYSQNTDFLANSYRYYGIITDMKGIQTKYSYSGNNDLVCIEESGKDHKILTVKYYDSNKMPSKINKIEYKVSNWRIISNAVTKTVVG